MNIWTEKWPNACSPGLSPVLNLSHSSFNRLLGAGPPCSPFCVTELSDDHVYAYKEEPPPVAVNLVQFHHSFAPCISSTSGWVICCFLLCNLCSHKGMCTVGLLGLLLCKYRLGEFIYRKLWLPLIVIDQSRFLHVSSVLNLLLGKDFQINHFCKDPINSNCLEKFPYGGLQWGQREWSEPPRAIRKLEGLGREELCRCIWQCVKAVVFNLGSTPEYSRELKSQKQRQQSPHISGCTLEPLNKSLWNMGPDINSF